MADQIDWNGIPLNIPEWAKDDTLKVVLKNLVAGNKVDEALVKVLKTNHADLATAYKEIQDAIDASTAFQKNKKNNNQGAATAAQKVKKDFETLLGSRDMKDAAGKSGRILMDRFIKPTADRMTGFSDKLNNSQGKTAEIMKGAATGLKAAEKGLYVYSGYVTGLLPGYQKISQQMIDHGMVYTDATAVVGELQDNSAKAGIKLEEATKIAADFAPVLAQIGGNTAEGMRMMLPMLDEFGEQMHALGDLGKSTPDLYAGFMEYLETLRYTGQLEGDISAKKGELYRAYAQLELEQIGLAGALGMKRSDAMSAINEAKMSIDNAVVMEKMRRQNFSEDQVAAYDEMRDQTAVIFKRVGEPAKPMMELMTMMQESIAATPDLTEAKAMMNAKLARMGERGILLQPLADRMFENLAQGSEVGDKFILELMDMMDEGLKVREQGFIAADSESGNARKELNAMVALTRIAMKNVEDRTVEEQKMYEDMVASGVSLMGAPTVAANTTEEILRQMVNSITPNMQFLAEMLHKTAQAVVDMGGWISETLDDMSYWADKANPFSYTEAEAKGDVKRDFTLVVSTLAGSQLKLGGYGDDLDGYGEGTDEMTAVEKARLLLDKQQISQEEYNRVQEEYYKALEEKLKEVDGRKASGGAVSPGKRYTVNELGLEAFKSSDGMSLLAGGKGTFSPNKSGEIVSANKTSDMFNSESWKKAAKTTSTTTDILGRTTDDKMVMLVDRMISQLRDAEAELYRGYGNEPNAWRAARDNPMQLLNEPYFQKQDAENQEAFIEFSIWKQQDKLRSGMEKAMENIHKQNMDNFDGDIYSYDRIQELDQMQQEALQTKEAALRSLQHLESELKSRAAAQRKQSREKFLK